MKLVVHLTRDEHGYYNVVDATEVRNDAHLQDFVSGVAGIWDLCNRKHGDILVVATIDSVHMHHVVIPDECELEKGYRTLDLKLEDLPEIIGTAQGDEENGK